MQENERDCFHERNCVRERDCVWCSVYARYVRMCSEIFSRTMAVPSYNYSAPLFC